MSADVVELQMRLADAADRVAELEAEVDGLRILVRLGDRMVELAQRSAALGDRLSRGVR